MRAITVGAASRLECRAPGGMGGQYWGDGLGSADALSTTVAHIGLLFRRAHSGTAIEQAPGQPASVYSGFAPRLIVC